LLPGATAWLDPTEVEAGFYRSLVLAALLPVAEAVGAPTERVSVTWAAVHPI
jgi:hypothetical protein